MSQQRRPKHRIRLLERDNGTRGQASAVAKQDFTLESASRGVTMRKC